MRKQRVGKEGDVRQEERFGKEQMVGRRLKRKEQGRGRHVYAEGEEIGKRCRNKRSVGSE